MTYLRSFAPWLAYAAGSAIADWRLGATAGLVVAVSMLLRQRALGLDVITAATAIFFAVMAPLALVDPTSAVRPYAPVLSLSMLGLVAAGSLAAGRPFTLPIARRSTPPELWDTDLFFRVNAVITGAWAASFLVTALVCAAVIHTDRSLTPVWVMAEVIGFIIPIKFTQLYRARIATRFAPAVA